MDVYRSAVEAGARKLLRQEGAAHPDLDYSLDLHRDTARSVVAAVFNDPDVLDGLRVLIRDALHPRHDLGWRFDEACLAVDAILRVLGGSDG